MNPHQENQTCSTCRFADFGSDVNMCRYYPPKDHSTDEGVETHWPDTEADDWCGKWQASPAHSPMHQSWLKKQEEKGTPLVLGVVPFAEETRPGMLVLEVVKAASGEYYGDAGTGSEAAVLLQGYAIVHALSRLEHDVRESLTTEGQAKIAAAKKPPRPKAEDLNPADFKRVSFQGDPLKKKKEAPAPS